MNEKISLFELQEQIKKGIEQQVRGTVWVTAEISEIKQNVSGHCYLDLVDYANNNKGVVAKVRGMIWASTYRVLRPYFETTAGAPLSNGMKVLLKVQVQYSPIYGLALSILDIDPSYTVGELEMKRQQTIKRLQDEGCFNLNSTLELPLLPRRFAIVSSSTAAGYRDFMKHLIENEYGYIFNVELYQAQMQGDLAGESMIAALDKIAGETGKRYDAVIIIRGGGSAMDLSCFDDYELASNIAQFPLPVITGIGHDQDFHICDMVAHTWLKTPTAVADFIIDIFNGEQVRLDSLLRRINYSLSLKVGADKSAVERIDMRLRQRVKEIIVQQSNRLMLLEAKLAGVDPSEILNRGFAVIYREEKRVNSVKELKKGEQLQLMLSDGAALIEVGDVLEIKEKK